MPLSVFKLLHYACLTGVLIALLGSPAQSAEKETIQILVTAHYPGASAQVVEATVATPIEEQVKGVLGMVSMTSRCANNGDYFLSVIFEPGGKTTADIDRILVQNRVALALPALPEEARKVGIATRIETLHLPLILTLSSPDGTCDARFLDSYAAKMKQEGLSRMPGITAASLLGKDDPGRLRVTLDAEKLNSRQLTLAYVAEGLFSRNTKDSAPLVPKGIMGQLMLGEFTGDRANLFIKDKQSDKLIPVKDLIVKCEMSAPSRDGWSYRDGKQVCSMCMSQLPNTKSEDFRDAMLKKVIELRKNLPKGLDLDIAFDSKPAETLLIDVVLPAGSSSEREREALLRCSKILEAIPTVQHVLILSENPFDRSSSPCILLQLESPNVRKLSRTEIADRIRTQLGQIQEIKTSIRSATQRYGIPSYEYPFRLAVSSPEGSEVKRQAFTESMVEFLKASRKLTDIGIKPESHAPLAPGWVIDHEHAAKSGVRLVEIANAITYQSGTPLAWDLFDPPIPVHLCVVSTKTNKPIAIRKLPVLFSEKKTLTVGDFVKEEKLEMHPRIIERLDGFPILSIVGNPAQGVTAEELKTLCDEAAREARHQLKLGADYRAEIVK